MNTHELIKTIENDKKYFFLFKKGLVSLKVMDYKIYYERFLFELEKNRKAQAITNVAEEYNISERTVRNAITKMQE